MRSGIATRLAAAVTAVLALASCSTGAPNSGAGAGAGIPLLKAGATEAAATLDTFKTGGCGPVYCGLMMEHLLKVGTNGKLEPKLATSWEQTSPVTYVYHLRHGVKFWDGNEMTSADVANSLNYARSPGSKTLFAFGNVKSVDATDRYTIAVTLNQPDASWKYSLSYEGEIFEKSFQDAHKTTMGSPDVLIQATGPWKVDSFDPTRGIELSANPHWWGGTSPVQRISFKFFSDEQGEALAMRAGEVDVAFPQDGRTFRTTSGAKIVSYPFNAIGYFGMNTQLAPWNDVHVRRAVAYALNRADIIAANGGGASATPVFGLFSAFDLKPLGSQSQIDALINSVPQYRFDLAKAKQEMAQSGYPNGFAASVDTRSDYVAWSNILQVIAAQLGKIGISLAVHAVPIAKWSAEISGPKTYGPMFSTLYAAPPDPSFHANFLFSSQNGVPTAYNFANYTSPALDDLLNAGLTTSDPTKRLGIYGQLLRRAAADVPYVPLFQESAYTALSAPYTLPGLNMWPGYVPWALDIKRTGS